MSADRYDHYWRIRETRMGLHPSLRGRKGQRCRVVATGARNSIMVEFRDGARYVTSRWNVRKVENLEVWA